MIHSYIHEKMVNKTMYAIIISLENATWNMKGVETVSVVLMEEGDLVYYTVTCRSFHLTSFAVLVDVYGVTNVKTI